MSAALTLLLLLLLLLVLLFVLVLLLLLQNDYDLSFLKDWELLTDCCEDAAFFQIIDSDCRSIPAKPGTEVSDDPPLPPDESQAGILEVGGLDVGVGAWGQCITLCTKQSHTHSCGCVSISMACQVFLGGLCYCTLKWAL
jgi:hypothetical protein